jgi:hypothetical protein
METEFVMIIGLTAKSGYTGQNIEGNMRPCVGKTLQQVLYRLFKQR